MKIRTAKHKEFRLSRLLTTEEMSLITNRKVYAMASLEKLSDQQIIEYCQSNLILGYRDDSSSTVSVVYGFLQLELIANLGRETHIPYVQIEKPYKISKYLEQDFYQTALAQIKHKYYGIVLSEYFFYIKNNLDTSSGFLHKKVTMADFAGIDRRRLSPIEKPTEFEYLA